MERNASKRSLMPNTIVLLMLLIVVVGAVSMLTPAGRYESVMVNGKKVIDPLSFHYTERPAFSFVDFVSTIHQGLSAAGPLIFMILMIGGSIKVFESTGAITGVVAAFARRFGSNRSSWVLVLIFSFFAILGAFPGMLEAAIPFAPICVTIALALGYDVIVGIATPVVAVVIGWTAGPTNPWTVGTGQTMAGLPIFSGMGYRTLVLVVLWAVSLAYILPYAARVKRRPSSSVLWKVDGVLEEKHVDLEECPFTFAHKVILLIFLAVLGLTVYGAVYWGWKNAQRSAFFLLGAVAAGLVARYTPNRIADVFVEGGRSIYAGVLSIGLARALSVIMEKSGVIDTVIHALSSPLKDVPTTFTASAMFAVQTVINFFIPSGSGQAMATLPIMLPMAEILGVSKQTAILAFQFGDGLSNLCYPAVAVLVGYLTYARVPFSKWLRFIMPYVLISWLVAAAFTVGAVLLHWQ